MTLNEIAKRCFRANVREWLKLDALCSTCGGKGHTKCGMCDEDHYCAACSGHGFEKHDPNQQEWMMLILAQLGLAAIGYKNNHYSKYIPHRMMAEVEMAQGLVSMLEFAAGTNRVFADQLDFPGLAEFAQNIHKMRSIIFGRSSLLKLENFIEDLYQITLMLVTNNIPVAAYMLLDLSAHMQFDMTAAVEDVLSYNALKQDVQASNEV